MMVANFGHGTSVVCLSDVGASTAVIARAKDASVSPDGIARLAANGHLWLTTV